MNRRTRNHSRELEGANCQEFIWGICSMGASTSTSVSSGRVASPVYPSPLQHHQSSVYETENAQITLPHMFDPSRPPPPIPQDTPSSLLKRVSKHYCEAGPSKLRKLEYPNDSCECCVQRLIRIKQLIHQRQKVEQEAEQSRMDLVREMDRYEKKKRMLRSILSPDIYRCAEDLIENMPSCSSSDDIGLLAMALRTRPNSVNYLNTLLEILRSERESAPAPVARPLHDSGAPASLLTVASALPFRESGAPANLPPYAEGAASGSAPLPYADAAPAALPYGEGPPRYPPLPRPFPPLPAPAEPPAPPAPQPSVARPMFSHSHFAPNNMPNPPYPGAAAVQNQPPRPPMPPNNPYFMGGRYPNQHYYPPYQ